ncbi:CocE/NonD family hydrolase [Nakamurella alba]|uniref:CocE/NonD family hydrolase n=1 Tax=Nakamurella alba TaxID=2665158 RepID=UPI002AC3281C|nr:CocE/NonD family hydrolase [Nakamurella alba]
MDGDITLHADVYVPKVDGRYPAVVSFGAYSTELHTAGAPTGSNEIGSPPVFTDRGYCPVIVERRGMGRSGGEQGPFFGVQDIDDHEAVIAWAAGQPWCNGEVVLFGTSYYGMTQPMVAARRPPALKAFFANEICTDPYRHIINFGGVPGLYFMDLWMGANFTEKMQDLRVSPQKRALLSHLTNGPMHPLLEKVVHRKVDDLFTHFMSATPVESVRRTFVDWVFDAKTREAGLVAEGVGDHLGHIDVPFVVVQNLGYFNLHQFGSYELFEKAGTPADRKWMILGPAEYLLPVYSWQEEALAFFDHVLRSTDNGYDGQAPVRFWVEGAETFDTSATFPPPSARMQRLYLASGGVLSDVEPEAGSDSWIGIPIGLPVIGGLDEIEHQLLTFELPVEDDTELAGAVTADLTFSCNEIDSYVIARLSRIDAEGIRHHLSMGAVRPTAASADPGRGSSVEIAHDTGRRQALTPGEPVHLRFSLTPVPVRLQAGDRLRLDVGSRSDLLRQSPADGYVQFDLPVPPYLCRNTLHFGGASWIEVDRIRPARAANLSTRPGR